ncbi:DegT/DnrJ/EryC1/StrS family aminotransferase [Citrobacter sp. EC_71]|uniref:DegT/DnrJ/EryC1/StrS family aminotransferase n=1 Tax=Citrobacter sp. EC_71 TaxID=2584093 RepID=UPI0010C9E7B8|nr:DegT/DnrJ/EryC1/StrS family aminotransferase [Citrobacter sp. EC_71]MBW9352610.1 DegT/DnrJ/EryC1/StrS family aminotransferase [Citrobacter sp. EC_71]TKU02101.1 DegT/DnrJ/EryC1/StrS family aminotransferase [Citrobacter sp. wls830]
MKNNAHNLITVTKPFLPPLEEFIPYLREIWSSKQLTNNGTMHQLLEERLASYLNVPYISLFCNATIALIAAMQTLRIKGEVITTPYSFVATTHSILWNQLTPVFVDIDPHSFNINPHLIESAITPKTGLIMPVHVYGQSCNTNEIEKISNNYGIPVIYDAAHAFAVEDCGGSILRHGDLSVLSFHATKVFNTFEGGAIVSYDKKTKQRIDYLKNFGIADELTVVAPGINGKMNEVQAAFGLLQLEYVDEAITKRKKIAQLYRTRLANTPGIFIPDNCTNTKNNYSYFPILIKPDYKMTRDSLYNHLKGNNILTRRYFYPLLSNLNMYQNIVGANKENLPVANLVSEQVLCLPIYPDMTSEEVSTIIEIITA